MRFKLDENLGTRGVEQLHRAGHDVMTAREQSLCGSPDLKLIEVCATEKRCLITLDFDFADTLTYPPEKYSGIVLVRLPKNPTLIDIECAMVTLIEALDRGADVVGCLWIVRQNRIRQFTRRPELP